jgi:hypothetical protein
VEHGDLAKGLGKLGTLFKRDGREFLYARDNPGFGRHRFQILAVVRMDRSS